MSLKHCEILFHKLPQPIFFSGESVSGTVQLKLDSTKKIYGLSLIIYGNGKCRWTETRGSGKNKKTIVFWTQEVYFGTHSNLLIAEDNPLGQKTKLKAGLHSFDFAFVLPMNLPPSFNGYYGRVKYAALVVLKKNYNFEQTHKVQFTVMSNVDLNSNPECRLPVRIEDSKSFSFFFTDVGSLQALINLPTSAFVPGAMIPFKCKLTKQGKVHVSSVKITLQMVVVYTATSPHTKQRVVTSSLAKSSAGAVQSGELCLVEMALQVPATPPTSVEGYTAIYRKYQLKVTVGITGFHSNMKCLIPITIGTVPLSNVQMPVVPLVIPHPSALQPGQSVPSTSAARHGPNTAWQDVLPVHMLTPPPTYDEAQASRTTANNYTTPQGSDDEATNKEDFEECEKDYPKNPFDYDIKNEKHSSA